MNIFMPLELITSGLIGLVVIFLAYCFYKLVTLLDDHRLLKDQVQEYHEQAFKDYFKLSRRIAFLEDLAKKRKGKVC